MRVLRAETQPLCAPLSHHTLRQFRTWRSTELILVVPYASSVPDIAQHACTRRTRMIVAACPTPVLHKSYWKPAAGITARTSSRREY
eukprot:125935-Rhodomonas_salina.4